MARMLIAALRTGGHDVAMASDFRSFLPSPDPDAMRDREATALHEVERLIVEWQDSPSGPPDVWFTYHPYYKAPDLIGAKVAVRFGMTYVTAEASHAGKRAVGPWARWHAANEAAIRAAALHVCFTARDAEGLAGLVAPAAITMLPPFLDPGPFGAATRRTHGSDRVHLVTVAMMRPGDKARSYAFLAEALSGLATGIPWHLTIVGDGPERVVVERLFRSIPAERLTWAAELRPDDVARLLASADLYVWPGFGEAYGIAYLEAQATGLPVLAMNCGGIASVVDDGTTGLLVAEGDGPAFAAALARLIGDPDLRLRLGQAGRRMVLEQRTVERAAAILTDALHRARAVA